MTKRTMPELVLLVISAFAVITISPFIYLRYIAKDYTMVALDAGIVAVMLTFFIFMLKTRNVELAKLIFSVLITGLIILVIVIRGHSHIYWIYPAIIAIYYILPERAAAIICLFAIAVISMLLYSSTALIHFLTILMTLLLTSFFSYAIFNSYNKSAVQLAKLATVDPLTLAGNRRALADALTRAIKIYKREPHELCLMLMDLDHFKRMNDNFGHAVGDQVLVDFVSLINQHSRATEMVFRYGGEEFIVAPLAMRLKEAERMAENLRQRVEQHQFAENVQVTVSIGIAQYRQEDSIESWTHRADSALYQAKRQGRNRVMIED